MSGFGYVFVNFEQAARFGHVAWGFSLPDGQTYCWGSTDHLWRFAWWDLPAWIRYMSVPAGHHIDWWCETGSQSDMLKMMKSGPHIRYHAYKAVAAEQLAPDAARATALSQRLNGWDVAGNNCVHQTYKVLSSYGCNGAIPDPATDPLNLVPRVWFSRISGQEQLL